MIVNRPFESGELFTRMRGRPLPPLAQDLGYRSWAKYFLKFILGHPAVTCVIPGTRNPEHVRDNLQAGRALLPDATARKRMGLFPKSG